MLPPRRPCCSSRKILSRLTDPPWNLLTFVARHLRRHRRVLPDRLHRGPQKPDGAGAGHARCGPRQRPSRSRSGTGGAPGGLRSRSQVVRSRIAPRRFEPELCGPQWLDLAGPRPPLRERARRHRHGSDGSSRGRYPMPATSLIRSGLRGGGPWVSQKPVHRWDLPLLSPQVGRLESGAAFVLCASWLDNQAGYRLPQTTSRARSPAHGQAIPAPRSSW
jgi:hypothetical protein